MMLRSKKVLGNVPAVAVKKRMTRNRNIVRSLSEVSIEGKSRTKFASPVLHRGTGLCKALTNCDSITGVVQSSSVGELSVSSQVKDSTSSGAEKCSGISSLSSTSSWQVMPNPKAITGVQSSSVTDNPVRSHVMEDSFEVVPIEISDPSEVEITANQPSSTNSGSPEADTSDIIVIHDSPGQVSVGNGALKSTLTEVPPLPRSRKRRNTDEGGVEILYDISGCRPKKQQKMECNSKEKKFWTNTAIKENFTVTNTDIKVLQHTINTKSDDVFHFTGDRSNGDGDDIIFISAVDEEVSVITPKKEHKPPQEEIIVLDSPAVETPLKISEKKAKKMVSVGTSITGLIPHYTKHLVDYISLDGKPPATTSGMSTGTPVLPVDERGRKVMQAPHVEHSIPVVHSSWIPKAVKQQQQRLRKKKAASKNRLSKCSHESTPQSNFVPVPIPPPPVLSLTGKQLSAIRNAPLSFADQNSVIENLVYQKPTIKNLAYQNSIRNIAYQNSTIQDLACQNSTIQDLACQNSTIQDLVCQNSTTQISSCHNSATQNSALQNTVQSAPEVSQSPACAYGTNIYNPNASEKQEYGLRPIIIDGNNIAMGHGKGKCFSWRGLHICIKYFLKRGHKVTAFVPTFRKGVCPPELRSEMEQYERSGEVVFTPSRRVEGRLIVPYDDRFIVQCAAELGGIIVSTDNFRDLLTENSSWKETIEKRLLMFTWVEDLLMFPNDPLGRNGPKLEDFLRFPRK